ncbi:MAG: hypothetical protein WCI46_10935 [Verrucomicrobiota bacterium]
MRAKLGTPLHAAPSRLTQQTSSFSVRLGKNSCWMKRMKVDKASDMEVIVL